MKKHRKRVLGVLLLFVICVAFFSIYSILSSTTSTSVSKTEKSAKTTDGASCGSDEEMNSEYEPKVSFAPGKATITVRKGNFKVTAVENQNLLTNNPMALGNLTPSHPLEVTFNTSTSGDVKIHFVLAEADDKCLSYDEAKVDNEGKKIGTYEFDLKLQLKPQQATPKKENTNYNGICAVFRTGQGYNKADFTVKGDLLVSKDTMDKYNYSAVNADGKSRYQELLPYCFQASNVDFNYSKEQVASMIKSTIDIWKTYEALGSGSSQPDETFMQAFNDAKTKALELGHDYSSLVKDGSITRRFGDLTCDWKKEATANKGDGYYVNKDYYYAKEDQTTDIEYTYTYTSGETKKESGGSCTRTCEESVVVEYGPPVASKAGLCFEYKVRVTSRVVCNSSLKLKPPKSPEICTPTPYCNEISGHTHQGGPNEEFEKCIQACDGGKYTQACSNQCYDKVYGDKNSIDPLGIRYGDDTITKKVWSQAFPGYSGRYDWQNGSIVWNGEGYGRWYQEFEDQGTRRDHGNYNVYSGFKKDDYGNGNHCQDNCYWSGCGRDSYLNEEDAAKDTMNNLNKYNAAIASCKASASCTTKTAEFDISVNYKHDVDGNEVVESVKFPIDTSNNKATLPSHGQSNPTTPTGTDIFIPDTNELGYAGCYDNANAKNWYQAEWSFPGTWINNKTGEIKFNTPNDTNAWHYKKEKFCVPLDAKSVNTQWWKWNQIDKNTAVDESKIDYNIKASTTDFGYFGWNFDFKCFYALKNEAIEPPCTGGDCGSEDKCDPTDPDCKTTISTKDFTFRIVDNNNLFPKSSDRTDNNQTTIAGVGRQPGYNWTLGITNEDASIISALNAKNPNYHIDPLALINNIQERGNTIYNGTKYRDYYVILDKKALAQVREFNKNKKYTDYSGTTGIKNGITTYYSDLLTDLNVQSDRAIGVNNESEVG